MKVKLGWTEYPEHIRAFHDSMNESVDEFFSPQVKIEESERDALKQLFLNILLGNTSFNCDEQMLFPMVAFRTGWLRPAVSLPDAKLSVVFGDDEWPEWETEFVGHIFTTIRKLFSRCSDAEYQELREPTASTIFNFCTTLDGAGTIALENGNSLAPHFGFANDDPSNRTTFVTLKDAREFTLHDYVFGWDSELYD